MSVSRDVGEFFQDSFTIISGRHLQNSSLIDGVPSSSERLWHGDKITQMIGLQSPYIVSRVKGSHHLGSETSGGHGA